MSEEQPNAFESDVKNPEQSEKVGLSKIVPKSSGSGSKSNGSGSAHSSSSAENVWNLKLGDRITQSFTKENPPGWFQYFDSLCFRHGLRSDNQKIDALIPCLDNSTFLQIQPLLDGEHTFNDIKVFLIQQFSKPLDQRLLELLNAPSLGEVKPSEFLNEARRAIKVEDMSDAVLCEILMTKLPQEVQTSLSIVSGCPMDEFARCADRAMIRFSGQFSNSTNMQIQRLERQVEQLKSTIQNQTARNSKSFHQNFSPPISFRQPQPFVRSRNPTWNSFPTKFCYYHQRFGQNARKCVRPCKWHQGN